MVPYTVYSIFNYLTVNICIFIKNLSSHCGGDISSKGISFINNRAFINNSVSQSFAEGGVSTVAKINNCIFESNHTNGDGGAIYSDINNIIKYCIFVYNSAEECADGIYLDGNSNSICCCTFAYNSAYTGGSIDLRGNNFVDSFSFVNNSTSSGGAIYFRGGVIANSSFTNTHVIRYGGDMDMERYTFSSNCVFNHSWADDGWINDGGDIYSREAKLIIVLLIIILLLVKARLFIHSEKIF